MYSLKFRRMSGNLAEAYKIVTEFAVYVIKLWILNKCICETLMGMKSDMTGLMFPLLEGSHLMI